MEIIIGGIAGSACILGLLAGVHRIIEVVYQNYKEANNEPFWVRLRGK